MPNSAAFLVLPFPRALCTLCTQAVLKGSSGTEREQEVAVMRKVCHVAEYIISYRTQRSNMSVTLSLWGKTAQAQLVLLDLVRVPPDGSRASLYQAASALLQHLGDDADAAWIEAVAKGGRAVVSGSIAGVSEGSGALPAPSTPVTMNPLHAAVVCVSRWPDKPWLYRSIKAEEPGSIESLPPVRRHLHDCLASPSASCSTPPDEMLHTGTLQSGGGKVKGTILSISHAHTHPLLAC